MSQGRKEEAIVRILDRTEIMDLGYTSPCWVCTLKGSQGYSKIAEAGRQYRTHRWSYEHFCGPVPDGHEVDHLCHNEAVRLGLCRGGQCLHRACWNPDHLEPATHTVNLLRGDALPSRPPVHAGEHLPAPHGRFTGLPHLPHDALA